MRRTPGLEHRQHDDPRLFEVATQELVVGRVVWVELSVHTVASAMEQRERWMAPLRADARLVRGETPPSAEYGDTCRDAAQRVGLGYETSGERHVTPCAE